MNIIPFKFINLFSCKTGNYFHKDNMLTFSKKPQVLRLHSLEHKQRTSFINAFQHAVSQCVSSNINRKLKSSVILKHLMKLIPDFYYSLSTILLSKRRLGQQYTYIAMYNPKHYQQQGLLLNKNVRTLLFVFELIGRSLNRLVRQGLEKYRQNQREKPPQKVSSKVQTLIKIFIKCKTYVQKYFGNYDQIMSSVQWLVLMVYLLDWNKYFTFLETILGINYAYTYKHDKIRDVSYAIEGYLLLVTFLVKAIKTIYNILKNSKQKGQEKLIVQNDSRAKQKVSGKKSTCRICYDNINNKSATKCGHIFCWNCIVKCVQISQQCPVCKTPCMPRQIIQLRNI